MPNYCWLYSLQVSCQDCQPVGALVVEDMVALLSPWRLGFGVLLGRIEAAVQEVPAGPASLLS